MLRCSVVLGVRHDLSGLYVILAPRSSPRRPVRDEVDDAKNVGLGSVGTIARGVRLWREF